MRRPARSPLLGLAAPLLAALACAAPPAAAHEADPTIATTADAISPALPGVSASVAYSLGPELALVNRSSSPVEVLGPDGRPFLRIGPGGVEANLSSAWWYQTGVPGGAGRVPPRAQHGGPARWARVAREPAWAWFDGRLDGGVSTVPPRVRAAGRPAVLGRWSIPLRFAGGSARVTGHVEFRPVLGSITPRLVSPPSPAPGLSAVVLPGRVPGLFLSWTGGGAVTVLGREGEPFARFSPRGVEVNERSPTHLDDLRARGEAPRVAADASAPPVWRRQADAPSYAWLDSRARYPPGQPPEAVALAARPARLRTWTIPVEVAGRRVALRGETDWVPSPQAVAAAARKRRAGGGSVPWWAIVAAVAGVAGLVGLAWALRRRAMAPRA